MENGRLEKQIRLPLDELKLAFAASCVEGLARKTGKPYIEVYERMSRVGAIENYILKNYDTLHTESREYVLEDVEEYINNKERSTACWLSILCLLNQELTDKYLHFYESERIWRKNQVAGYSGDDS